MEKHVDTVKKYKNMSLLMYIIVFILIHVLVFGNANGSRYHTVEMVVKHMDPHEYEETYQIRVVDEWAPIGAKRFIDLVKVGFYDEACFFRVIKGFIAQVGMPANPEASKNWTVIHDEAPSESIQSNTKGLISFATSGKNSRTFQIFFNYADNSYLDQSGFTPFGELLNDDIDTFQNNIYLVGEGPPTGMGPSQGKIGKSGNEYLKQAYPKLSCIKTMKLIEIENVNDDNQSPRLRLANQIIHDATISSDGSLWIVFFLFICIFALVYFRNPGSDQQKMN